MSASLPVAAPTATPSQSLTTVPEAAASLLYLIVVALFLHTFVLQPFLIPSESMERTLLVGDFLLFNKQIYGPTDPVTRALLPYQPIRRGDIVVFHHPHPAYLIKRVVGLPGDRLRMQDEHVLVNGVPLAEPYAAFEPAPPSPFRDAFPAAVYTDPEIDPEWWRQMQSLVHNGELTIPPGRYFVLGDNRNHSKDSRFWGFVRQDEIVARPLVIYFSLTRPSTTDVAQATDDRLGHDRPLADRISGFARWKRIFHVVR